jgi:hypothetical protein
MVRYKLSSYETNDEESSEGDAMQPSERHLSVHMELETSIENGLLSTFSA